MIKPTPRNVQKLSLVVSHDVPLDKSEKLKWREIIQDQVASSLKHFLQILQNLEFTHAICKIPTVMTP